MMKILVVDDNQDAAESLMEILEMAGHEVAVKFDGEQAVASWGQAAYQLMFLDLKMPGMNGDEVARQILEEDPSARIVIVTGNTLKEDLDRLRELSLVKVIRKPFDVDKLLMLVAVEGETRPH